MVLHREIVLGFTAYHLILGVSQRLTDVVTLNKLVTIGIALVFIGMLVIIAGFMAAAAKASKVGGKVEGGGIVFIGPIPIVWGTSKGITQVMLILALAISVILLILYLMASRGGGSIPIGR